MARKPSLAPIIFRWLLIANVTILFSEIFRQSKKSVQDGQLNEAIHCARFLDIIAQLPGSTSWGSRSCQGKKDIILN